MGTLAKWRIRNSRYVVLGIALLVAASAATAQETEPSKYLDIHYKGECDKVNKRAFVSSSHPDKTILATLQWRLSGGKRISTNVFRLMPGADLEIGCAGEVLVTSAVYD